MTSTLKTEREKNEIAFGFLRDLDIDTRHKKTNNEQSSTSLITNHSIKEIQALDDDIDKIDSDGYICLKKTIFTHLMLTPIFVILSALTGTAILSAYFNGYDLTESTTMAAIGGPFAIMLEMCFIPCTLITATNRDGGSTACSIWWNTIFATVIGYGIYNGYKESEIKLGQIAAASSLGSSILAIPYLCIIGCCAANFKDSKKANHGEESMRINTNPDAIEEGSSPSEPTRQAITRV